MHSHRGALGVQPLVRLLELHVQGSSLRVGYTYTFIVSRVYGPDMGAYPGIGPLCAISAVFELKIMALLAFAPKLKLKLLVFLLHLANQNVAVATCVSTADNLVRMGAHTNFLATMYV